MNSLIVAIAIIILILVLFHYYRNYRDLKEIVPNSEAKNTLHSHSWFPGVDDTQKESLRKKNESLRKKNEKKNYKYDNIDNESLEQGDESLENKATQEYYKSTSNNENDFTGNDWAEVQKASALDDKVYDNHNKFLHDAKKKGVIRTSQPRYYDQHVPEPIIEWKGFYRPQKVPIRGNSKQIPDVDTSSYANRRTFDINTGW